MIRIGVTKPLINEEYLDLENPESMPKISEWFAELGWSAEEELPKVIPFFSRWNKVWEWSDEYFISIGIEKLSEKIIFDHEEIRNLKIHLKGIEPEKNLMATQYLNIVINMEKSLDEIIKKWNILKEEKISFKQNFERIFKGRLELNNL